MSVLIASELATDEQAERNAPPDERLPWVRRCDRDTPRPTEAELRANWRRLMDRMVPR